jgi:phytoene dehydrogenase-like protein
VFAARDVLVGAAPAVLDALLAAGGTAVGEGTAPRPEGSQLKVNMLLRRLPPLRDASVDPREAFAGTFHIAEGYRELQAAYGQAAAGQLPSAPPSEVYCHSLSDPSILSAELAAQGAHTLTLFGLHAPARLFAADPAAAKEELLARVLERFDAVLAEPLADCLALDADGRPCLEAKSPPDLEAEVGLPGGHIFHRDLSWPYDPPRGQGPAAGRWGVGTGCANVYLCGAGAARGGGVSGIPGHNAAMAVLEK